MLCLTDTYWFFIHYHNAIGDSKFSQFYTKRLAIQTAIFDDRGHKNTAVLVTMNSDLTHP